MIVNVTLDGAEVKRAEGTVWAERFSLDQCADMALLLDLCLQGEFKGVPIPLTGAFERVRDMFYALTNDSDACIVYQEG